MPTPPREAVRARPRADPPTTTGKRAPPAMAGHALNGGRHTAPHERSGSPYGDTKVRERMAEFLGGRAWPWATAVSVAGRGTNPDLGIPPSLPAEELDTLLETDQEVVRSLWDRSGLLVDLDIEYVNFDFAGEPYLAPERSFGLQRPVVRAVREVLAAFGIPALHLLSGRGHHFLWNVDRASEAYRRLVELGQPPPSLMGRYRMPHPPAGAAVDPDLGRAFAGLGLVVEYLGHRIRDLAAPESAIPVELGEIETSRETRGREIVAIDLSAYADPLPSRHVIVPFSRYLKPYRNRASIGEPVLRTLGDIFILPHPGGLEPVALRLMREPQGVLEVARTTRARIPEAGLAPGQGNGSSPPSSPCRFPGMVGLIEAYRRSPLARVHEEFYADEHDPPDIWHRTYDRTPVRDLPAPARAALARPNDLLLKPRMIYEVVRSLLTMGWHPRHVAGLIRSRYERPHGWGDRWYRDDAWSRADHYTRLFTGMLALDRGPEA